MTTRADVIEAHPNFPWLDADCVSTIEAFLRKRTWIGPDETVAGCTKAGDGNMNLTLRIETDSRTFILKQARPWVEKYDHIAAPWDRILYEQRFYERIQSIPTVAAAMPSLIASDAQARVIIMEDMGTSGVFSQAYNGETVPDDNRKALAQYLAALHSETRDDTGSDFANREMRMLNHEHMFLVPLAVENGMDLDAFESGLCKAASDLQSDLTFVDRVRETGERYLEDGPCLQHGDYFPGSWLNTRQGARIIDPEFCFRGDPEFDVGICLAHLRLSNHSPNHAAQFIKDYTTHADGIALQGRWIARYASVEIMRRLLGVAQLPIAPSTKARRAWLTDSLRAMRAETIEALWS